jgi:hypothetical protein
MKTLIWFAIATVLLLCSAALAVDPDTSPQETTPQPDRQLSTDEGAPRPFPEQMIVGKVTGSDDKPVGGVAVKLFADGLLVEVAHTTSAGDFEIPLPLRIDQDETVVLWFIDSAGNYPPQDMLIKKSSKAGHASLFSPCTRDARMRPQMRVDFKLMTDSELAASYKARGCL